MRASEYRRAHDTDIAARLSATAVECASVPDAQRIIREFLAQVIVCSACNDTGEVVFGRDAELPVTERGRREPGIEHKFIEAGAIVACPHCGGRDAKGQVRHDPAYVAWHCEAREREYGCSDSNSGRSPEHDLCGYRIVLPIGLFESETK